MTRLSTSHQCSSVMAASASPNTVQDCIPCFSCVRGTGVAYFRHICAPTATLSGYVGLQFAQHGDLAVRRTVTELGKCSFHIAALAIWNTLPDHLHSPSVSKRQFRYHCLKTHLFQQAYNIREPRFKRVSN